MLEILGAIFTPIVIMTIVGVLGFVLGFLFLASLMMSLAQKFKRGNLRQRLIILIPLLLVGSVVFIINLGFTILILIGLATLVSSAREWGRKGL